MVLQGAWVKGIKRFVFGTDETGLTSRHNCTHFGSLSSALRPFENVAEIGVPPEIWTVLGLALVIVCKVSAYTAKVIRVGNRDWDGSRVWHSLLFAWGCNFSIVKGRIEYSKVSKSILFRNFPIALCMGGNIKSSCLNLTQVLRK